MKYTVTILVCAAFFAIIGAVAAWGAADYYTANDRSSTSSRDMAALFFIVMPFAGAVVGTAIGCLAVHFGKRCSAGSPGEAAS